MTKKDIRHLLWVRDHFIHGYNVNPTEPYIRKLDDIIISEIQKNKK